jgi:predicted HTH transcriptional regulator
MSDLSALEQKLDLLIALARVSVRDQLARERRLIDEDPVSAEILRATQDWTPAGKLKEDVRRATGQSEPTIKRRIADLVSRGALARQGAGRTVSYRTSGLFDV